VKLGLLERVSASTGGVKWRAIGSHRTYAIARSREGLHTTGRRNVRLHRNVLKGIKRRMVMKLISYLEGMLHMPVMPLSVSVAFPLYLKETYEIQGIDIRGRHFLAAHANTLEQPPAATQKQLAAIEQFGGLPVIPCLPETAGVAA
jgi:hypothetical protein